MSYRASAARQYGDKNIYVERVNFIGIRRTKSDALIFESKHLFSQKTFRDLVLAAYEAKQHMQKVGLFKELDVIISTNKNASYEVQFLAQEPMPRAMVNGNLNNRGEVGASLEGSIGTVFGRGEVLSAETTRGYQHTSMFTLGFTKPLLRIRDATVGFHVYRSFAEYPWTGVGQTENGLCTTWRYEIGENIVQELKWLGSWRQAECLSKTTPFAVREHSGHSLKSSIINVLKYSTLDSAILPTRGIAAALNLELAGIGGDAQFVRNELDFRASTQLPLGFILSLGANAANVTPLGGRNLYVLDRVFMGGPTNLRGFTHNGVGPHADGAFVGGSATAAAAVHLYRPLYPKRLVFAHAFFNSGNIWPTSVNNFHFVDALRGLTNQPRWSVGWGRFQIGRNGAFRIELLLAVYGSSAGQRQGRISIWLRRFVSLTCFSCGR